MKHIRTAVVGCGYWGKNLVRNFAGLSDLAMCCDESESVRKALARQYPSSKVVGSYQEVLENDSVDAVVLATPAHTHAELAVAALQSGKHVFVEKPLALSVADAERVAQAVADTGRILMVGHLLVYHPAVDYLKTLIESGELGEVYYCYSQRLNLGKVRSDENALWSLAPHDISIILHLIGEEPEEVEASGQAFLQPNIEDVVFLLLRFPSGRVAHIHVSWLDPNKERRLTVVGSKKMAVFDDMNARGKITIYDKSAHRRLPEAAPYESLGELVSLREGDVVMPRVDPREPLQIECAEFLRSVATGVAPRADINRGVQVVRVLEAAQAALDRQRLAYEGTRHG